MSPDEVCSNYSGRAVRLSIRLLEGDVVLLEGDRVSLEFLAELIRGNPRLKRTMAFRLLRMELGEIFLQSLRGLDFTSTVSTRSLLLRCAAWLGEKFATIGDDELLNLHRLVNAAMGAES